MIALPEEVRLRGRTAPRLAPPVPAKSLVREYAASAKVLDLKLMPWQTLSGRYLTARNGGHWLYREVAIVVARQNGKTTLLLPLIHMRLKAGRRILHTAQNRSLPRETFLELAARLQGDRDVVEIRYANGQEVIKFANGGRYTLVAPTKSGARGHGVDDVLLDEVREQGDFELIASIKPAITASKDPQIIYLSNAGDSTSVVLNDLRRRSDTDPALAYLEWSAAPERDLADRIGWAEGNPALGITIQAETLEDFHRSLPPAVFETEHLCRWVVSMQPRLVADPDWQRARAVLEKPLRPAMAVSMDPSGTRASAAIAWRQTDGSIGLRMVSDVRGDPIDLDTLGPVLRQVALRAGAPEVGFAPWTDADLARFFRNAKALTPRDHANASERFVRLLMGRALHWDDAESVTEDLAWTARRPHESGAWAAVKAQDDRPITSVLAAIHAVWLTSETPAAPPRIM